jgi:GT2 family glycosyltransferase
VDVVIPFRGSPDELQALLAAAERIALSDGDTLSVVDNGPGAEPGVQPLPRAGARLVIDGRTPSSYYARNRGAEGGSGEWILFIDADVTAPADLLERYFDADADERVAVLTGAVQDEVSAPLGWRRPAARYTHLKAAMSQSNTLRPGPWGYAQTANCAVRRSAFEAVGGFTEDVRSGGDADLCFRLRAAGWELVARENARVVHRNRPTLRALLRQRARHGSGAAWLNRRYPGSFPPRLSAGTVLWSARQGAAALRALLVDRDGDRAILLGVEVLAHWAFELGRLVPNGVR